MHFFLQKKIIKSWTLSTLVATSSPHIPAEKLYIYHLQSRGPPWKGCWSDMNLKEGESHPASNSPRRQSAGEKKGQGSMEVGGEGIGEDERR